MKMTTAKYATISTFQRSNDIASPLLLVNGKPSEKRWQSPTRLKNALLWLCVLKGKVLISFWKLKSRESGRGDKESWNKHSATCTLIVWFTDTSLWNPFLSLCVCVEGVPPPFLSLLYQLTSLANFENVLLLIKLICSVASLHIAYV